MSPELLFLLILFLAAVGTVLFWAAVLAAAMAIGAGILLVLNFLWWLITRPIVWPIRAIGYLVRPRPERPAPNNVPDAGAAQNVQALADRLERLKALLDDGALSQAEYDKMKAEILG